MPATRRSDWRSSRSKPSPSISWKCSRESSRRTRRRQGVGTGAVSAVIDWSTLVSGLRHPRQRRTSRTTATEFPRPTATGAAAGHARRVPGVVVAGRRQGAGARAGIQPRRLPGPARGGTWRTFRTLRCTIGQSAAMGRGQQPRADHRRRPSGWSSCWSNARRVALRRGTVLLRARRGRSFVGVQLALRRRPGDAGAGRPGCARHASAAATGPWWPSRSSR